MTKVLGRSPARRKFQVIELRLMRAHDMFEMPQTDLFSEYRNFLTGVDFCLSELRGRRSWRPVRLRLPSGAVAARTRLGSTVALRTAFASLFDLIQRNPLLAVVRHIETTHGNLEPGDLDALVDNDRCSLFCHNAPSVLFG